MPLIVLRIDDWRRIGIEPGGVRVGLPNLHLRIPHDLRLPRFTTIERQNDVALLPGRSFGASGT